MASVNLLRTALYTLLLFVIFTGLYIRLSLALFLVPDPIPAILGNLVVGMLSFLAAVSLVGLSNTLTSLTSAR